MVRTLISVVVVCIALLMYAPPPLSSTASADSEPLPPVPTASADSEQARGQIRPQIVQLYCLQKGPDGWDLGDDFDCFGFNDLNLMLDNWGPCPGGVPGCVSDFDGDGDVDFDDMNILLDLWGECCSNYGIPL